MVLFNIGSVYHKLGHMKGDFWKYTHIGIPDPDTESNDAVVLGYLVAQFIGEVGLFKRFYHVQETLRFALAKRGS